MKLLLLALVALASAEPESDSLFYNQFGYNTGYTYPVSTYSSLYPTTAAYNGYYGHPYSSLYHHYVKREAEAEPIHHFPQVYYNQYPYYKTPVTHVGEPVYKSGTFHTNLKNVAKGVHSAYAYPHGQVYQPVSTHFVKREAEAESEPYYPVGYPTATHYPLSYNLNYQYPASTFYNGFYNTYPTTAAYHGLFKRDAEADSDSESFYNPYYRTYGNFYNTYRAPYVNNFAYRAAYTTPVQRYFNRFY